MLSFFLEIEKMRAEQHKTRVTNRLAGDLLQGALCSLEKKVNTDGRGGELICSSWAELIGHKLSSMAEPLSFEQGLLVVNVKNSTLYSLLETYEKPKLLERLRRRFPTLTIKSLIFRLK